MAQGDGGPGRRPAARSRCQRHGVPGHQRRTRDASVGYHWSYRDGVPGDGGVGGVADADLALTITRADAGAVASGEVEPSVAFMRGRLKATGSDAASCWGC